MPEVLMVTDEFHSLARRQSTKQGREKNREVLLCKASLCMASCTSIVSRLTLWSYLLTCENPRISECQPAPNPFCLRAKECRRKYVTSNNKEWAGSTPPAPRYSP
jgi:hypothetical protein